MRYLPLFLLVFLLLPLASAAEFDNEVKPIDTTKSQQIGTRLVEPKTIWTKYAPLEIKNAFGFGDTLATGALEAHTESCDANDCSSMFTLATTETSVLVQDITFWTMDKTETTRIREEPIRGYQLYLMTSESARIVNKTKLVCVPINYVNGSSSTSCTTQNNGTKIEYDRTWEPYTIGTSKKAGTYTLRLDGQKKPDRAIDWVIKTQGKWLDEWSTWGISGYGASVTDLSFTLNSDAGGTCEGFQITTKKVIRITNITVMTGGGGSYCRLVSGFGGSTLDTGVITGTNCPLPANLTLPAHTKYVVCTNNNKYSNGIGQTQGTNLNFTGIGCYTSTGNCDQQVPSQPRSIVSITSQEFTNVSSITVVAPANNTGSVSRTYSPFNATANVVGATLVNMSYWDNSTGVFTRNKTTALTGATNGTNFTQVFPADGTYQWSIQACDTDGACGMSENRTITIDATAPTINITYPTAIVDYQRTGTNLSLNWTVSDPNLQACYYSYAAGNITVTCNTNTTFLNTTTYVNRTAIFYANDSSGNLAYKNQSWNYKVFSHSESPASQLFGGSTATYTLNFSSGYGSPISSVILNYNGTSTYGSINDYGGDGHQATVSQYTPVPASSGQNKTGYWTVNFNDGTAVNTSTFNQTILTVGIDNCASNTQVIYNYSMLDEDDQTNLTGAAYNTSIRVDFGLYSLINTSSPIVNYSTVFSKTNISQICIQAGVLGSANYSATSVIQYSAANRVSEFLFIQNQSLTNTSVPYQIKLYDLLTTSAQSFRITYKDQNLYPVPGVIIQVWRYYINEGTYKLVEAPITNPSGVAIAHLVPEDAIYTFIVTENGRTIDTFTNNIVYCTNVATGDCSVNLQTRGSFSSVTNYQNYQNINYTIPVYNKNTRVLSSSFINLNAQAVTFSLNVSRFDNYGNQTLCSGQLTAPSGTTSCTIPASFGNGTMIADVYVDGVAIGSYNTEVRDSGSQIFGNYRILFALLLLGTIPLISLASAGGTVIMFFLGGFICASLFIIDGSFAPQATVVWLIIVGGTLLYKMSRRE